MKPKENHREYWKLIWNNFKAGDRKAFEIIYNEFSDVLFAYGSKITSDREMLKDCIQDVFVDVYKYGTEIRNPESLDFYLFKTLKRNIIRKLQKQKVINATDTGCDLFKLRFDLEDGKFQDKVLDEELALLQQQLKNLDVTQREILFLKFNSGLSYNEIGKILNMKPDTAKKQVYRLLDYLRKQMKRSVMELFCFSFSN